MTTRPLAAWLVRASLILLGMIWVAAFLVVIEASHGHDGLLCEWGYDSDGPGDLTTGCE